MTETHLILAMPAALVIGHLIGFGLIFLIHSHDKLIRARRRG